MCVLKVHALLAVTPRFGCFVRSTLPMEGKVVCLGERKLAIAGDVLHINERNGL